MVAWLAGKVGIGGGSGKEKDQGYDRVGGMGGADRRDDTPSEVFAALSIQVSTEPCLVEAEQTAGEIML